MPGPPKANPDRAPTEEQVYLVEQVLRGTPIAHVARELGVRRQTCYEWLEQQHVQNYIQQVMIDLDGAVVAQLLAEVNGTLETLRGLRKRIDAMAEDGNASIGDVLSAMKLVDDHLRLVAELYRVSTNRPSEITENRGAAGAAGAAASERLAELLDRFTPKPPTEHPIVDVTPTDPPEEDKSE